MGIATSFSFDSDVNIPSSSPSSNFLLKSHPDQLLVDHLKEVTDIALRIFDAQLYDPVIREVIRRICMAHDIGKSTTFFQDYIELIEQGKIKEAESCSSDKDHALLSALFAYWWLPAEYKLFGFLAVKRHHGDIKNARDEYISQDRYARLRKQVKDIQKVRQIKRDGKEELRSAQAELECIYGIKLDDFFDFVNDDDRLEEFREQFDGIWEERFSLDAAYDLHQLHSYLLAGDKLQLTARGMPVLPDQKPPWYVDKYKAHTRELLLLKNPELINSRIFNIRDEIFAELETELARVDPVSESFFSINIPTGTGKTFLSYKAAFDIAARLGKKTDIIYALPYMSIIDQNFDVIEDIIRCCQGGADPGDDELLKCHSLAEVKYETGEEYKDFDARFLFDNWQSRIVATTFVQVCNTIFKIGAKATAHRFNRLANSIIILDEIQAIDEKFHVALCALFDLLAKRFGTKFIFVSATMPLMNTAHELIPNKKLYFEQLNRITLYNHSAVDTQFEVFKGLVAEDINKRADKSFLIVLNTIRAVNQMYAYLKERVTDREIICLSTEIYPDARLKTIKYIKRSDKKFVLVSTQLIEAGVDLDFDVLYRDFAPLSSLNQTAGRVNRNGLVDKGEVHIYLLVDENDRHFCDRIYPQYLIAITRELLAGREVIQEHEIFELNEQYAANVAERLSTDRSEDIIKYIKAFEFEKLRECTNLIPDESAYKHDVFIEADAECKALLRQLRDFKTSPGRRWERRTELQNLFRALNKYRISIYDRKYKDIRNDLKQIKAFDIEYLPLRASDGRVLYSKKAGIVLQDSACAVSEE